jgi:hypothetical protein
MGSGPAPMTLHDGWATRVVKLGAAEVWIDDANEYLETRWPDGLKLGATPDAATGTTWQQTVDHELGHTWLATDGGRKFTGSPTLWVTADRHPLGTKRPLDVPWVREEEARVLAWQATLPADGARPWDAHTAWANDEEATG